MGEEVRKIKPGNNRTFVKKAERYDVPLCIKAQALADANGGVVQIDAVHALLRAAVLVAYRHGVAHGVGKKEAEIGQSAEIAMGYKILGIHIEPK